MDSTGSKFIETPSGLVFQPWIDLGIRHLFGSKEFTVESCTPAPALLRQVHGATVVVAGSTESEGAPEGDGWIVPSATAHGAPQVFAIRTADCLPILIRSAGGVALVHAGWRGLAAMIIAEALRKLPQAAEGVEVLIGPAAGAERYEIGGDVVRQIGESAVVQERAPGRFLLNLAATAARQVQRFAPGAAAIFHAPYCTMSDARFHSHRRDAERAGRNITVLFL